jgi:hypothetical protein
MILVVRGRCSQLRLRILQNLVAGAYGCEPQLRFAPEDRLRRGTVA